MTENRPQQTGEQKKAIDDAQFKRMVSSNKPSFFQTNKYRIVTLALIAINVIVFGVEAILAGFRVNIPSTVLIEMGAMYVPAIQSVTDLYRFITPMFLHVDFMHLAFNMVALFSVGGALERALGKGNYLLLYFIAGITGNVACYVTDIYITGTAVVSAGASTSVFGLFVAVALLGILFKGNRHFYAQFSKGMIVIIVINVFYSLLVPGISISGHLGGAIGGLFAMLMVPSKNLRVNNVVRILVTLAWVGALIFVLVYSGLISF